MGHKADFKSIDSIVFENAEEVEKIMRNYEIKTQHEAKVQSAYMADIRTQLEDMQKYQNTVDAKLQTALRFIDWFMSEHNRHTAHVRDGGSDRLRHCVLINSLVCDVSMSCADTGM